MTMQENRNLNQQAREENPIRWFEIPTEDLTRAKAFYTRVFGVALRDLPSRSRGTVRTALFPKQVNASGAAGALVCREDVRPSQVGTTVYFSCEELSQELQRAKENGAQVVVEKTDIGENGFIAHFIDTEGNRIGLHSMR